VKRLAAALLDRLAVPQRKLVDTVVAEADAHRELILAVGGPVRDLLLGRPARDFDLVVGRSLGAASLARAAAPPGARVTVHERFGTARIESAEATLDLATLRRECYAHPGALPQVASGTLEEDLARRDFTVNALAVPLSREARRSLPELVDPGGAGDDLAQGVLRIFHPRSFHDDPTRALRAARLAARLGFRLARGTGMALRTALDAGCPEAVTGERWRRELEQLFADPALGLDPVRALSLLQRWGVLGALARGLEVPVAARVPLRRLGRFLAGPPWPPGRVRPWVVGLVIWGAWLPGSVRRRFSERLALRGSAEERIREFARRRAQWLRELGRQRGRGALDRSARRFCDEDLIALYCCAPTPLQRRLRRWSREDRMRRFPVGGRDLETLGLRGPAIGAALGDLRVAALDGKLRTRDEMLVFAREWVRQRAASR